MASLVQMGMRHNLLKSCIISKLSDIKIFTEHVRYYPRWAHRRPLRVIYPDDSNKEEVNFVEEKLRIERQSIQDTFKDQKNDFHYSDNSQKGDLTSEINLRSNPVFDPSSSTSDIETIIIKPEQYTAPAEQSENDVVEAMTKTSKKNRPQNKSKKEWKLEKRLEMKAIKKQESAAKAGVPLYTKLDDNDPKLSTVMLIAKSKKKKSKRSHIVLEGKRLIKDALKAGFIPQMVFFSRVKDAADLNLPDGTGIELYKLPYKTISLWSTVTTSPGIIAILKTPVVENLKPGGDVLPLTIVCDNIRDPGNMGSILRGAAGVGCQKIILTKGCVDIWDPKVLRSGSGAHFRTPIITDVEWVDLDKHVDNEASVFLADNNAFSVQESNEDTAEEEYDEDTSITSQLKSQTLENNFESNIPVIPYFGVDYVSQSSVVLVVGGETEGLSIDSFKFAHKKYGVRLNVPLTNDVESLNSGTALGIIVFEMKRQFLTKSQKSCDNIDKRIHVPNI